MIIPKIPHGRAIPGLLLGAGAIFGGRWLWKKWREGKNVARNGNGPENAAEFPFGSMESAGGEAISLKSVSVKGEIDGLLFSSTIIQEYRNETGQALEIIYTFPLGWSTTLLGMDAEIGGKRLHGVVVRNAEAEKEYEEAIEKGDSAIMVQESSLGLYTANLGNIKPGEAVRVELHCARLLNFEQGRIRVAIPTVIGERYGDPHSPGGLAPHESARVDVNARYGFSLELILCGIQAAMVECPTHGARLEEMPDGVKVALDPGAALDRDFVLLINGLSGESSAFCAPDGECWMELASFCPRMDDVDESPLGLKILVDCSGSMCGMSIQQAQKGLGSILRLLTEKDYASYSRFGSGVSHLAKEMLPCDSANLAILSRAIDATEADMGGTEMEKAVLSTINDIKEGGDAASALLLITDGDVWNVKGLIEGAKGAEHRIFIIGVGAAPAESLLMSLAEQTGGACEFVTPNEDMAGAITRMFHRMRGKTAKDVSVNWHGEPIWQSAPPRHVYDGETIHSFALFARKPERGPVLSWKSGGREYSAMAQGVAEIGNDSLVRVGRKRQLASAPSEAEKLAIALKYQLVCDLTSLILVYEREEADKLVGMPKIQQTPQMPAYGHGCYANAKMAFASCLDIPHFLRTEIDIDSAPTLWDNVRAMINGASTYAQVRRLVEVWRSRLMILQSLGEFIALVGPDREFKEISRIAARAAKACGATREEAWAVLLKLALEANGGLDRHSQRLLRPYLGVENAQKLEAEIGKILAGMAS